MADSTAARLEFALPGDWWRAPLEADPETRARAIAEFVRARYGRRDDLARTRAEHRARLAGSLDAAVRAGATAMHVSESNDGGIAFASTLTEYALPGVFGSSPEPAVLADRVVGAVTRAAGASTSDPWSAFAAEGGVAFAKGESIVLRRVVRRGPADAADAATADAATADAATSHPAGPDATTSAAVESLTADYWITVPGRPEVVLVSLSTALGPLEPLMLELFDRVIAAATWRAAPSLRDELTDAR
ncbi:hypothetical protein SAMN05428970_3101 [Agromyces sp. CF514]|uniref:hypothetical protein n=1 Tax=Agromyces sp. CF514 TaxID=1881031 RepID=UPI0008ED8969|nr:hypothetical protein [Agromyces sp. CF514]SFR85025.1 hypothetical protein SAMN05428970_3101 [Agromyces sp. CF514]